MPVRLALFEDKIVPGRSLAWRPAPRVIYVRGGSVRVRDAAATHPLTVDRCALFQGELAVSGDGEIWTFEISAAALAAMDDDDKRRTILAAEIDLDATKPVLFRADRVDFLPDGVTPRHGHKGSGIRRLLFGRLVAEIGHEVRRIESGQAWFESGRDPVIGRNIAPASAFVRGLALPVELKGQPTFIPWTPEEASKPRGVRPQPFFDEIVTLPSP
ncbi:MAG: hypothetical protein JNK67_03260 [Alphaproteobacteria bacterium]|nr:hypothetical protein [Alphaproteobacteria bacterium]